MADSRDGASRRHAPPLWNASVFPSGRDIRQSQPAFPLVQSQGTCSAPRRAHAHDARGARRWLISSCRSPTLAWAAARWSTPALFPESLSPDSCLVHLTGTPGWPYRPEFQAYAARGTHLGLPYYKKPAPSSSSGTPATYICTPTAR
ncbi:hypothetical protein MRX96_034785 [Rhipicephalus microplus]